MNIINHNPYRVLGVYANASLREITANKTKLARYASVGRSVSFDADLDGILSPVDRTETSVEKAFADLSLEQDKLKYALFWFVKDTPIDDTAFGLLKEGKIREAKLVWETAPSMNFSSVQNRVVCNLIENNLETALVMAEFLYESFTFSDTFIDKVNPNSTMKMSGTDLLHLFIDTLGAEVGMDKLFDLELLQKDTAAYIKEKTVAPLVTRISDEVDKAKRIDHHDVDKRLQAGNALVVVAKQALEELKKVLGADDSQYKLLADKIGIEILQCGIDYFNGTEDSESAYKALELQQAAQAVVVGEAAKQRCDENVEILKKNMAGMAPRLVVAEDKAIKSLLDEATAKPDEISCAVDLLNNAKSHLQTMKDKLGVADGYYLKMSSLVVSVALHKVIEVVNEAQKKKEKEAFEALEDDAEYQSLKHLYGMSQEELDRMHFRMSKEELKGLLEWKERGGLFGFERESRDEFVARVAPIVKEAWGVILVMDGFDMEKDVKEHYDKNRSTLRSLCIDMGVPYKTEEELEQERQKEAKEKKDKRKRVIIVISTIFVIELLWFIFALNARDFKEIMLDYNLGAWFLIPVNTIVTIFVSFGLWKLFKCDT